MMSGSRGFPIIMRGIGRLSAAISDHDNRGKEMGYLKFFLAAAFLLLPYAGGPEQKAPGISGTGGTGVSYLLDRKTEQRISDLVKVMSRDERISQLIIPAARTWKGSPVTDLDAVPGLREILGRHGYGGLIFYAANLKDNEHAAGLLKDLQKMGRERAGSAVHIPYFTLLDQEGGPVTRLRHGTRMTGSMAIGATSAAAANAELTGRIIGEELSALGFNVNLAPVIDVNMNPANPVIGVRSFSDDPGVVAGLGIAYARGVSAGGVIPAFKHYPGHGDTVTDSHRGLPLSYKPRAELMRSDLIPFREAVRNGADMIMTAHIASPGADEPQVLGDGIATGYYPAAMSRVMIADILRGELGYDGVVISDALEMEAVLNAGLVPGKPGSAEYQANIAAMILNAGADMLLLPADLKNPEVATFYDDYIAGISDRIAAGIISEERLNESVIRVLRLKVKYGIFDIRDPFSGKTPFPEGRPGDRSGEAGSREHQEAACGIAGEAVTLLKNNSRTLPFSAGVGRVALLAPDRETLTTLSHAAERLREEGYLNPDTVITADYYLDPDLTGDELHYPPELRERLSRADAVIGCSALKDGRIPGRSSASWQALSRAIADTHAGGGRFALLSGNLPYDAALYPEADAIVLSYLGSGMGIFPDAAEADGRERTDGNCNAIAAMERIFGKGVFRGTLPVNIPEIRELPDGSRIYGTEVLYRRGFREKGESSPQVSE